MEPDVLKKTCKMCRMEIPKESRKCPYCQHFQNRVAMFLFHPGFVALFVMIPFAVMFVVITSMMGRDQDFENYKDQIVVATSQIFFGDRKSEATVDVIGTIKNTSPIPWSDIYFHVDFFDATGKQADVGSVENYEYYLPASETSSFKLSFAREFPETNYVKAVVRVVSAKDARARW
ncbi:MAG TPA: hypothetical protein VMJ12_16985 [Candidatus Acidoferrales bacterium]|nr:hypothetical protein [Candidatus Acidoferrales bacterium]